MKRILTGIALLTCFIHLAHSMQLPNYDDSRIFSNLEYQYKVMAKNIAQESEWLQSFDSCLVGIMKNLNVQVSQLYRRHAKAGTNFVGKDDNCYLKISFDWYTKKMYDSNENFCGLKAERRSNVYTRHGKICPSEQLEEYGLAEITDNYRREISKLCSKFQDFIARFPDSTIPSLTLWAIIKITPILILE